MKKYITIVCLFFFLSASHGQSLNSHWKRDLDHELAQFKGCENKAAEGIHSCNNFIGNMLPTVYQINDFYSKTLGRHMRVIEISDYLHSSNQWILLGRGYEQKALNEAQQYANAKKAVVAIYVDEAGIGNVSLILPGTLRPSGSWKLQVPNSASFFLSDPEKSYMDKGLSYSFERLLTKEVFIYGRKY